MALELHCVQGCLTDCHIHVGSFIVVVVGFAAMSQKGILRALME